MGFGLKELGKIGLAGSSFGLSLLPDDSLARVPVLGALFGSKTDAQKQLLKKQAEMAEEAKKRMHQNEQTNMNALAQSMLAFNPQNQMMAQMFGPEAAFTPDQMAQMVQNPTQQQPWGTGTDEQRVQQVQDKAAEEKRQQMVRQGIQQPGPGPAPLQQRAPQAARRY